MTLHELSQVYYLTREIELLRGKISRLRESATSVTQTLSGAPGSGRVSDKVGDGAARISDAVALLESKLLQQTDAYTRAVAWIETIPDTLLRQIFSWRYLYPLTWNQVAARVGGGNTADTVRQAAHRYLKNQRQNKVVTNVTSSVVKWYQ